MAETARLVEDETVSLWRRFRRRRSKEIRNRLIESYLPLVRVVAARISQRLPPQVDPEDLRSAGVFGLVSAIENYDPDRGVKFETYCRKRVAGAMLDELRKQDWIPREVRERADLLRRTMGRLREQLGREPSDCEVAEAMCLTMKDFQEVWADVTSVTQIPLDVGVQNRFCEDGASGRYEPIDAFPEPPDVVFRQELLHLVDGCLSNRERSIVNRYYRDEQTMKRIGKVLSLSESRVCQMHSRMLNRLKARLYQEVAP